MAPSARTLGTALLATAAASPFTLSDAKVGGGVALRILPVGDSVTYGSEDQPKAYRDELASLLTKDGNKVDIVGTTLHGMAPHNKVEASSKGETIDELLTRAGPAVKGFLPNLVLLNPGTAECENGGEAKGSGERLLKILELTWDESIFASVVLATSIVPEDGETKQCVSDMNEEIRNLVKEQTEISTKVVLVDFDGDETIKTDDEGFPTEEGYKTMAKLLFDGIDDAGSRGWLEEAEDLPKDAPEATEEGEETAKKPGDLFESMTASVSTSESASESAPEMSIQPISMPSVSMPSGIPIPTPESSKGDDSPFDLPIKNKRQGKARLPAEGSSPAPRPKFEARENAVIPTKITLPPGVTELPTAEIVAAASAFREVIPSSGELTPGATPSISAEDKEELQDVTEDLMDELFGGEAAEKRADIPISIPTSISLPSGVSALPTSEIVAAASAFREIIPSSGELAPGATPSISAEDKEELQDVTEDLMDGLFGGESAEKRADLPKNLPTPTMPSIPTDPAAIESAIKEKIMPSGGLEGVFGKVGGNERREEIVATPPLDGGSSPTPAAALPTDPTEILAAAKKLMPSGGLDKLKPSEDLKDIFGKAGGKERREEPAEAIPTDPAAILSAMTASSVELPSNIPTDPAAIMSAVKEALPSGAGLEKFMPNDNLKEIFNKAGGIEHREEAPLPEPTKIIASIKQAIPSGGLEKVFAGDAKELPTDPAEIISAIKQAIPSGGLEKVFAGDAKELPTDPAEIISAIKQAMPSGGLEEVFGGDAKELPTDPAEIMSGVEQTMSTSAASASAASTSSASDQAAPSGDLEGTFAGAAAAEELDSGANEQDTPSSTVSGQAVPSGDLEGTFAGAAAAEELADAKARRQAMPSPPSIAIPSALPSGFVEAIKKGGKPEDLEEKIENALPSGAAELFDKMDDKLEDALPSDVEEEVEDMEAQVQDPSGVLQARGKGKSKGAHSGGSSLAASGMAIVAAIGFSLAMF